MADGLVSVFAAERDALLRFLRARGAGDEAEDLLQDLWLKLRRAPPRGPVSDPRAYLFRAANNLMLDRARAGRDRRRREREWSRPLDDAVPDRSDEPSPEQALLARRELEAVQRMLEELGEPTMTIFRSYRLDGMPQKRIAERQGLSLSAVEKHLQKAYRALIAFKRRRDAE
ncbi:RNA polymerase subunit sigma-70 [Pacificimonas flava]|uniref:RNA polymerase subunit sigma-70 n=2 Tax=Pacificimonas TaxID=1960290 RepID=A0A219B3U9_9SPHN|nr:MULTISPECIES: sigma-70 family RNA polymerase sigma factor [Pacificimonas]MBZ6377848.1 sigma-70 family RNA polymerase sigma factor [Pacificimonas aurantium]OWV32489.1 RNA polymerase subunit sigma-70 [Pacificimonas flava]